jgi:hypothetical protein
VRLLSGILAATVTLVSFASAAQASPASAAFVSAAYQVVLHRPADPVALAQYPPLLDGGSLTQAQLVQQLMNSDEFRASEVNALYQHFLGRGADAAALNSFLGLLGNGATTAQVAAVITASPEYFSDGGGTNTGFIRKLYADGLGRPPGAVELNSYLGVLNRGVSRTQLATTVLQSVEGSNHLLLVLYQNAMHRTGTPNGSTLLPAALSDIRQMLTVHAPMVPLQPKPLPKPTV